MSKSGTGWWLDQIGRVPLLTPVQEIELGNRIQAWLEHPDGPDNCPPKIRRSGRRAKDAFVAANLRLAVSYVTKHCHRLAKNGHQEDLIQAANLGVIRAVEKFDPTRGYRFSTYAYWWIRQSVNRWIDQHTRSLTIPGSHAQLLGKIEAVKRRMALELDRQPTLQELADDLNVKCEMLETLLSRGRQPLSLDQAVDDDHSNLSAFVGKSDALPEEAEQQQKALDDAFAALDKLTPQERRIVEAFFGFFEEPVKPGKIARRERISPKRVKSIINFALVRMRSTNPSRAPYSRWEAGAQLSLLDCDAFKLDFEEDEEAA